jgi:hypothetical protein
MVANIAERLLMNGMSSDEIYALSRELKIAKSLEELSPKFRKAIDVAETQK